MAVIFTLRYLAHANIEIFAISEIQTHDQQIIVINGEVQECNGYPFGLLSISIGKA
jgi:hypothetical protein